MLQYPNDVLLDQIETHAIDLARGAGAILNSYLGKTLDVQYKDEKGLDPVTNVDKAVQEYLEQRITACYPDHSILGEESEPEEENTQARDFIWVLDPLDGTKNFLAGLPIYACSIGLLYRGTPIVSALFIPWPSKDGGVVLHARRRGGAFLENRPIPLLKSQYPRENSLVALPGSFGATYRFRKNMRDKVGEPRVTGSIAYEQAITSLGIVQYSVTTRPRLWDVAAGVLLVMEAGGLVMLGHSTNQLRGLLPTVKWKPLESLLSRWSSGVTTLNELRQWSAPMVLGAPGVVRYVTTNIRVRRRLNRRLSRLTRGLR